MEKSRGFIDTNIVVHYLMGDERSAECGDFLNAVRRGDVTAELHPLVAHEMTYTLLRYRLFPDEQTVAEYLRSILRWPGLVSDVDVIDLALERWGANSRVGFVDAYLIEAALRDDRPVYTINRRDFVPFGVTVPTPLPSGK